MLEVVHFPFTSPSETNSSSFWENSSSLEKELKSEKEQRQALQRELQQEKDTSSLLRAELQQVEGLKKVRQPSWGEELPASPGSLATWSPARGAITQGDGCTGRGSGKSAREEARMTPQGQPRRDASQEPFRPQEA